MGSYGNPQTTQADVNTIAYCLQTDSKASLLMKASRQLIEDGEVELVSTESPHLYILASLVLEGSLHGTEERKQQQQQQQQQQKPIKPATKPVIYSGVRRADTLQQWWHKACWNNQPISDLTSGKHTHT